MNGLNGLSTPVKRGLLAGLLLSWALASLGTLAFFEQQHFGVFDPQRQLLQLNSRTGFSDASVLIAVIDPTCYCARAARAHLQLLKQQNPSLQLQELTPAQWRASGAALPATPLVLWYQHQQLRYAGPLAQGPICSSEQDILLPLLQGRRLLAGIWLNSDTVACRCLPPTG